MPFIFEATANNFSPSVPASHAETRALYTYTRQKQSTLLHNRYALSILVSRLENRGWQASTKASGQSCIASAIAGHGRLLLREHGSGM